MRESQSEHDRIEGREREKDEKVTDSRVVDGLDTNDVHQLCALQWCTTHDDVHGSSYSLFDAREVADSYTGREFRCQTQCCFGDNAQCAFSSDEELGEIEACTGLARPGAGFDHFSVGGDDSLKDEVSKALSERLANGQTRLRIHSALAVECLPQRMHARQSKVGRTCSIAHCICARTTS